MTIGLVVHSDNQAFHTPTAEVQHSPPLEVGDEDVHHVSEGDALASHLSIFGKHQKEFVYVWGKLGRAHLVETAEFFGQWGKMERISNDKRVRLEGAVPWTMQVNYITSRRDKFDMFRDPPLYFESSKCRNIHHRERRRRLVLGGIVKVISWLPRVGHHLIHRRKTLVFR